ncbi:hypothetical protein R6Z07F_014561 [Ovis aries]
MSLCQELGTGLANEPAMKRGQLVIQRREQRWTMVRTSGLSLCLFGESESELVLLKAAQMVKCTVAAENSDFYSQVGNGPCMSKAPDILCMSTQGTACGPALELTLTGAAAKHVTWGDARQAIPLPRAVRTTATCTAFNTGREWPSDCLLSSKCKVHNGGDSGAVSVSFVSTYHLVTVWCRVDFTHYPPLSNEWIQQPNSQQFKRPHPPPLPWKMKQRQNESKRLKEHENIRKQMYVAC